jgi:hypothetical protein
VVERVQPWRFHHRAVALSEHRTVEMQIHDPERTVAPPRPVASSQVRGGPMRRLLPP